jgi:hypothetical protein
MAAAERAEKDLYPTVAAWLRRHRKCFKTAINTGLSHSRIDVIGIRDTGGDLSGETETTSVEVKRGTEPFATATGQALGYKVYANRVYLADYRDKSFSQDQIEIASHLGVGLIRVTGTRCREELSSPYYKPITRMNALLMEKLGLGCCRLCGSVFETGVDPKRNRFSNLSRENVSKAISGERGLLFWNREVAARKAKLGIRPSEDGMTYERRFICPDCVTHVISNFVSNG